MKIVGAPGSRKLASDPPCDLSVTLYGRTELPGQASIGASVLDTIKRAKLAPAARAWDLLSIALAVIAADTGIRRKESPDGWTRELDLQTSVIDPDFWEAQAELLKKMLAFLTTDIWRLSFVGGGLQPVPPRRPTVPSEDCVSLLSGGLDSLVGAIDLVGSGRRPYLVSQVSQGDKKQQAYFAAMIGGGLSHLQLNHNVVCPGENERSQRARSLVFLAYAALLASSLRSYKQGSAIKLFICENGYISVNPPLTGTRLGSLSTKTTHPVFLALFQQLLNAAGLLVTIENPYQFSTKGEMLSGCVDQEFLSHHSHTATSCGRYARNGYKHCGRCLPCIIRRSSFRAWGIADKTFYVYADLSKDDDDHARFDDVRSAAMAAAETKAQGIDRWIAPSLNSSLMGDVKLYKDVVRRGLDEVAGFLAASGVK